MFSCNFEVTTDFLHHKWKSEILFGRSTYTDKVFHKKIWAPRIQKYEFAHTPSMKSMAKSSTSQPRQTSLLSLESVIQHSSVLIQHGKPWTPIASLGRTNLRADEIKACKHPSSTRFINKIKTHTYQCWHRRRWPACRARRGWACSRSSSCQARSWPSRRAPQTPPANETITGEVNQPSNLFHHHGWLCQQLRHYANLLDCIRWSETDPPSFHQWSQIALQVVTAQSRKKNTVQC